MKIDNKYIIVLVGIAILIGFAAISSGQSDTSNGTSKTAVAGSITQILEPGDNEDKIINQVDIHANKDLEISVSAETILYTYTKVVGKKDAESENKARATVQVWAEVDGVRAYPSSITFGERIQEMNGKLNETEWIDLALTTTDAHAFNFIAMDVGQGWHNVTIHANVTSAVAGDDSDAWGAIGRRTVVVEDINVKNNYNLEY